MTDRTYRGLDCVYEKTPIPIRTMDWLAFDPATPEASYLANGSTLVELMAAIDSYCVDKILEAIEPVRHWYQSDEQAERPLPDIITDIVADLQADRTQALRVPAMTQALIQYRSDMRHRVSPDSVPRRISMIDKILKENDDAV